MPSFQELLVANLDDVTETNNTTLNDTPTGWDCGLYGAATYHGGVRFIVSDGGVGPLSGATINAATLTFDLEGFNTGGGSPSALIVADDVDNAAAWADANRPSQITQTTATRVFTPGNVGLQVADVKTIIQEIVDRPGWAPGNAMRFAILQTSITPPSYFTVDAINDAAGAETVLDITYTAALGGAPPPRPLSRLALQQRM